MNGFFTVLLSGERAAYRDGNNEKISFQLVNEILRDIDDAGGDPRRTKLYAQEKQLRVLGEETESRIRYGTATNSLGAVVNSLATDWGLIPIARLARFCPEHAFGLVDLSKSMFCRHGRPQLFTQTPLGKNGSADRVQVRASGTAMWDGLGIGAGGGVTNLAVS